ncbi:MAG: class I SAM-dependent methyltransferase [Candidatus Omnitrophota bacterium]|nr:class I SAM-dependent methyltransferase [Candidatus Omnitrophota bacterium]
MTTNPKTHSAESNLRTRVRDYTARMVQIEDYLAKQPGEWGRFQSEFNQEINQVFRDLMTYEKECLETGEEQKVYKLKRLFVNRFRDGFSKGEYIQWSLEKPYGYAGDYKIIDDIYRNSPTTQGVERLFDNYFMMSTISNAVRNRKSDCKRIMTDLISRHTGELIKLMNLASGPCRDVLEILSDPAVRNKNVAFQCADQDLHAIDYASKLLNHDPRVKFVRQNAVRIALKKDIESAMEGGYDAIYTMGLFDYLDSRVSVKLIQNLRKLLKPGGILVIWDVRDKFSNPSVHFMEWVGDWNLTYRDDDEFRSFFVQSGFRPEDLEVGFEQQGIIQYVIGTKR